MAKLSQNEPHFWLKAKMQISLPNQSEKANKVKHKSRGQRVFEKAKMSYGNPGL